jgi:hypothetical protein
MKLCNTLDASQSATCELCPPRWNIHRLLNHTVEMLQSKAITFKLVDTRVSNVDTTKLNKRNAQLHTTKVHSLP